VVLTVEEIFDTLKNGKWHDFMEISEKTRLSMVKLKMLTNFLAEYEFIELDERKQRTRLTPSVLIFLKKIQEANEKRR
jgi:DNA-binding IclR family transcriptional regulator